MLKSAIRNFIGESTWYFLAKARREYTINKNHFHGDAAIWSAIKDYIPNIGTYIDVGAHDGRTFSNTYHLENLGWNGVLVEPVPWKFFDIKRLRSRNNYIVNCAAVSFKLHGSSIKIQYGDLMTLSPEISTIDSDEWSDGAKKFMHSDETEVQFWIQGLSLTSILDDAKMGTDYDFLSIDVEGAELDVLQGIDFEKYKFGVIAVETYTEQKLVDFLHSKEYKVIRRISNNLIAIPNQIEDTAL
jgi:FkbM family methyltransferase